MATPDNSTYGKLIDKLRELFELDKADLDFGIYRIIRQRQDEIEEFLRHQLKTTVNGLLNAAQGNQQAELQAELRKAEQSVRDLGMNPDQVPKVLELREKLKGQANPQNLEDDVYEHLYRFFSRYYEEGDFISLRRVSRKAKYAIPYNGEEVKLHWANADQYYIKSSENFRDYRFKLNDGRSVHFKLVDADTNRDNTKGEKRFFRLASEHALAENDNELLIHFHYTSTDDKKITDTDGKAKAPSQVVFNNLALAAILQDVEQVAPYFQAALTVLQPTKANPKRTVLEKHLSDYTAKNSFDYFIHKNLGEFLRQELDFYIKNEVVYLDDIDNSQRDLEAEKALTNLQETLQKIRAIRQVAGKVIDFLAQLEDFQKKLWLKKKFVVSCDYCFTLDRVPEALYAVIAGNAAQAAEWRKWNFIEADTVVDEALLRSQPFLMVDTRFYPAEFKFGLLKSIEDIDAQCDGLLLHADNYQGLQLIKTRFSNSVKSVYLDPPYNTDVSAIPYKNNYRHSSWASMMQDRLALVQELMTDSSACYVSIDKNERNSLEGAMNNVFGEENKIEELIWIQNTNDGRATTFSTNHEYIEVYSKNRTSAEQDYSLFREPKPGYDEVMQLVLDLNQLYLPPDEVQNRIRNLHKEHIDSYREQIESEGLEWDIEKRNDPWKGIYQYKFTEYRDSNGKFVNYEDAEKVRANIWVYRESDWTIMESDQKQSPTTKEPNHPNYRYYQPTHPITGKPCAMPSRGWKGTQFIDPEYPNRNSWQSLLADHRIAYGHSEEKVPQQKRFLHEVETNVGKSVIVDYSDGEKETSALFDRKGVFLAPKHTAFVSRFIRQSTKKDSIVLDIFGGSGSTPGAVINCNRTDAYKRKFIAMEANDYIYTTIIPRLQKTVFSSKWINGNPISQDGVSFTFKYMRLESYEDTLNNLELKRSGQQQTLLDQHPAVKEDYLLHYMLDIEAQGSLLKIDAFTQPFNYQLQIATDSAGETRPHHIDLVETFNYLLGLSVHTQHKQTLTLSCAPDEYGVWHYQKHPDSPLAITAEYTFLSINGTLPDGKSALVIWRVLNDFNDSISKTCHNIALDHFLLERLRINPREGELDVIYVNGDNTLPNIRSEEEHWKVRLIEEEFQRLMFAGVV